MVTKTTDSQDEVAEQPIPVKFCPICGTKMYQGERYGFMCWICPDPDCDYDEPIM